MNIYLKIGIIILAIILLAGGIWWFSGNVFVNPKGSNSTSNPLDATEIAKSNTQLSSGSTDEDPIYLPATLPIKQLVVGNVEKIEQRKVFLDTGWIIGLDGNTRIQYPSGAKLEINDIKVGTLINVELTETIAPGEVRSEIVRSIIVFP